MSRGLQVIGTDVEIGKKVNFTGRDGKAVRFVQLVGFGFTSNLQMETDEDLAAFPEAGAQGDIRATLESKPDGTFKLKDPKWLPLGSLNGQGSTPAGGASSRSRTTATTPA